MDFTVPRSAFDTEPEDTFEVSSPANLFLIYMLARNWRQWVQAFHPVAHYSKDDDRIQPKKDSADEANLWTVVGVDEGEYVEAGIRELSGSGFYTHGFIETQVSRESQSWEPDWTPDWRLMEIPGVTIQFDSTVPAKTIWVGCEVCSEDEVDECVHLASGSFGTWLSLDFDMSIEVFPEQLLRAVAGDLALGALSCIAAGALIRLCLAPQSRTDEVEEWTQKAGEYFVQLSESQRDIVLADSLAVIEP